MEYWVHVSEALEMHENLAYGVISQLVLLEVLQQQAEIHR
jgi:hypothetical protein